MWFNYRNANTKGLTPFTSTVIAMKRKNNAAYTAVAVLITISVVIWISITGKPKSHSDSSSEGWANTHHTPNFGQDANREIDITSVKMEGENGNPSGPKPPARPWKCTFHQKLPSNLTETPATQNNMAGAEAISSSFESDDMFEPRITVYFAEVANLIKLDAENIIFFMLAKDKSLPAIDEKFQRIAVPVFGQVDDAENHGVFSIRNIKDSEITVISIPIPAGMMLALEDDQPHLNPGWIKIVTRRKDDTTNTPGWLHFSVDK